MCSMFESESPYRLCVARSLEHVKAFFLSSFLPVALSLPSIRPSIYQSISLYLSIYLSIYLLGI